VYFIYLEHDDTLLEAAPPVHFSCYQLNAPTLHSSVQVQDQRYGMPGPYVNGMARDYGVWTDAQQNAPFAPAAATATASIAFSFERYQRSEFLIQNAMIPYTNQNQDTANSANGPMTYHQDNRIPGHLAAVRFRLNFHFHQLHPSSQSYFPFFCLTRRIGCPTWGRGRLRTRFWWA